MQPAETRSVSINDIVSEKLRDHKGYLFSPTTDHGEIQWSTEFGGTGLGRLVVTNSNKMLARSFSCPFYYNLCNVTFGPNNLEDIYSTDPQAVDLFSSIPTFCSEASSYNCNYTSPVSGTQGITMHWTTSSNVSTQASSSNDIQLTGISAGPYTVSGYATWGACTAGPVNGGGTVNTPTYFISTNAVHVATPSLCTQEGATGYFIDNSYYVADQYGNRMSQQGLAPGEQIQGNWNDAFATPSTTRPDGSFDDVPFGACYGTATHYCDAGHPQQFRLTANGKIYPISTNTTSRECTDGIQVNIQGNPTAQNKTITLGNVQ